MDRAIAPLHEISERIKERLSKRYEARERAIILSREIIYLCFTSIRCAHREEIDKGEELLKRAMDILKDIKIGLEGFPELLYSGFLQEAEKELSEAAITLSIIGRREIPKPEDIDVSYNSYLHGLGEAVGELRRYVLDLIRRGEDGGEEILDTMEEIYLALTQMDFPDAITGGLRRTTDNVRGIIERTRGDLSLYIAQRRLERKLERG